MDVQGEVKEGAMGLPLDCIVKGDSLIELQRLPESSVDVVFADPPYNLQLRNELRRPNQTVVDAVSETWDKFESFAAYDAFTKKWLQGCRRVLKECGTLWVIGSYHNIYRIGALLMDLGYWVLNDVHWHKTNPMPNFRGRRFQNATETLLWAVRSRSSRYRFNYKALKAMNGGKQMGNVWHLPLCTGGERLRVEGKKAHPTQKPEALIYRVLMASTVAGDVVLDPFVGTGTTAAVAKRLGRRFIGIEREAAYVKLARERIAKVEDPLPGVETALTTIEARDLPRVPFADLVACGWLKVGDTLYGPGSRHRAIVRADGTLADGVNGSEGRSIHQFAASCLGRPACNGWEFWHYETANGSLESIDILRTRYRREYGEA